MKKISTLTGILIILAVALVLFGGVFWLMQNAKIKNQNEVANWKTYRNDEFGFEFKYPENLNINGAFLEEPGSIIEAEGSSNVDSMGCFSPTELQGGLDYNSYIIINDLKFCKSQCISAACSQYPAFFYTTFKNGNYYVLTFGWHFQKYDDIGRHFNAVNQINEKSISTFKFTK